MNSEQGTVVAIVLNVKLNNLAQESDALKNSLTSRTLGGFTDKLHPEQLRAHHSSF